MLLFFIGLILSRAQAKNAASCQTCHRAMRSSCGLTCQACHLSAEAKTNPALPGGHPAVIANPSAPEWWNGKCLSCHQKEISDFKNSLHYSNAGIIDQTRFLFGKNKQLLQTSRDAWRALSSVKKIKKPTPAGLVDHLLAGKCLTCHFASDQRKATTGRRHAAGCAACHIAYDQQTGKVRHGHRFQKRPDDAVCLSCHSGNHVGADYYGFFEHDYHRAYQTPYAARPIFGAFQHRLRQDIHRQKGMQCIDCHREHSGHSKPVQFEGQNPNVRCTDCHGGFKTKPNRANTGARLFSTAPVAHQSFHANVRCSACHAQWSYQDYGLHLFLDQSNHYEIWQDYLWQGDGALSKLLQKQLALPPDKREPAYSLNSFSGRHMPGAWYVGWSFRRWENPILGRDTQGKFAIIRPLFQYFVTYVDSLNRVWLDSQKPKRSDGSIGWNWDAYIPHTIARQGRNCESCHGNVKAVGLGIRQNATDSVANAITLPSAPVLPGSRLLNDKERERLLRKDKEYRYWRTKDFLQKGMLKLFGNDSPETSNGRQKK